MHVCRGTTHGRPALSAPQPPGPRRSLSAQGRGRCGDTGRPSRGLHFLPRHVGSVTRPPQPPRKGLVSPAFQRVPQRRRAGNPSQEKGRRWSHASAGHSAETCSILNALTPSSEETEAGKLRGCRTEVGLGSETGVLAPSSSFYSAPAGHTRLPRTSGPPESVRPLSLAPAWGPCSPTALGGSGRKPGHRVGLGHPPSRQQPEWGPPGTRPSQHGSPSVLGAPLPAAPSHLSPFSARPPPAGPDQVQWSYKTLDRAPPGQPRSREPAAGSVAPSVKRLNVPVLPPHRVTVTPKGQSRSP